MQEDVQIVLGIPGNWPTQADIVAGIVKQGKLVFTGNTVTDLSTQLTYSLDIHERDHNLAEMLSYTGQHSLSPQEIERIAKHTYVLYLIGPGGMVRAARDLMQVADYLLQAGGLAVQVTTSSGGHSAAYWHLLTQHRDQPPALFDAYVTLMANETSFFSAGMHNLGLPDALVDMPVDPNEAGELLQTFLLFTLLENPDLKDGHTFRVDPQSPLYRLSYGPCETHEPDNLMYNPYGMWRLHSAS
jgi:hypothetical protein